MQIECIETVLPLDTSDESIWGKASLALYIAIDLMNLIGKLASRG